jgi:hypothetical protein
MKEFEHLDNIKLDIIIKETDTEKYPSANGDVYDGDFINGFRSGKGKFYWANGNIYEGDFIDNKRNGKGKFTWVNGDVYEGNFIDGKITGNGKLWSNGYVYEGYFIDGIITGRGKSTRENGDVFEGDFRYNNIEIETRTGKGTHTIEIGTGKGTHSWANGDVYEGDFVDGKRTGKGKLIWWNDYQDLNDEDDYFYKNHYEIMYEGDFVHDKRTGKGKITWADDNVYVGDFIDDKRTGNGKYTWANGNNYEGDFVDGVKSGKGKFTWANGDVYEGDFIDGKFSGKGKFTWANGDIYIGDFVDDNKREIFPWYDGNVYEDNFIDKIRTGRGKFTAANGDIYESDFIVDSRTRKETLTWRYIISRIETSVVNRPSNQNDAQIKVVIFFTSTNVLDPNEYSKSLVLKSEQVKAIELFTNAEKSGDFSGIQPSIDSLKFDVVTARVHEYWLLDFMGNIVVDKNGIPFVKTSMDVFIDTHTCIDNDAIYNRAVAEATSIINKNKVARWISHYLIQQ